MQPGPALAQKIGPLGLNVGQIIQKVNQATNQFNGLKVPVTIHVNVSTKEINVEVLSPPVSELLKKEVGVQKGSGLQNKLKIANASIEQIISVAKSKQNDLLCKDLKSAVKTVAGTCVSLGIIIENKSPVEVQKEIDEGKYDKEIKQEITKTPEEKKTKLDLYFKEIQKKQDQLLKQEQDAKEVAATAAKTETATPAIEVKTTEKKTDDKKTEEPKKTKAGEKSDTKAKKKIAWPEGNE